MLFSNTGEPYPFKVKLRNPKRGQGSFIVDHTYVFFSRNKLKHIVSIHEYNFGVSAVKFNLAKHNNSKNRYKYISNQPDRITILKTVIAIMVDYTNEYDKHASFAFIGSPIKEETISNTKRFRIYKHLSSRYFNPDNYDHKADHEKSFYAILNKKKDVVKLNAAILECVENEMKILFDENTYHSFSETRLNLEMA